MKFDIKDFTAKIICEGAVNDAHLETDLKENAFDLYLTATADRPKFIELKWDVQADENTLVLGDAWERSYADLGFVRLCDNNRPMPWYFIATDKKTCFCLGVKTCCNSFVSFRFDKSGISALVDVRNGGNGVHLDGRKLCVVSFICAFYDNAETIDNLKDFCKKMSTGAILPETRVYGGNNWYYAYGKSSYKQIVADAAFQAELSEGLDNKPFEVIDDCWQPNRCAGPWYPNRKFKDMKKLADEIKELGVRPGIWVRLLRNKDRKIKKAWKLTRKGGRQYLDPTHPEAREYIKADIERIKGWGYELLKHDFTTADLFGLYGGDMGDRVTKTEGWHFYDKTRTNAEIVLDFYRLIKETAGDMLIIGCNTISHLSVGNVHIYRTGDDTSGLEWKRTKEMGVNTLAFRLAQNEVFYMCDADCVGIVGDKIPWEKNSQWLHLLSHSNTPLFVSCTDKISEKKKCDLRKAYIAFNQPHSFRPLDIYENKMPREWEIDGRTVTYNW